MFQNSSEERFYSQYLQPKLQTQARLLLFALSFATYFITVPLVPPAVVSMTLVVKLTRKSSWSKPSNSAQYSKDWLDLFFNVQPPNYKTQLERDC